uniref:Glutathione peroxidase n=1 Tax=Maylandia zebra TaxID=106582 RepID=A0A3P9BRF7_9CICH
IYCVLFGSLRVHCVLLEAIHVQTLCVLQCNSSVEGTIYKYRAKTLNGSQTVNFSNYAGKAVLFVNVATY